MIAVPDDELPDFAAEASGAVEAADDEAHALGHDRVGTEHLLLGLLADESSVAAKALRDAGVTAAAARRKAAEAVGTTGAGPAPGGPLPRTARAARALGRSRRFCHARHADLVASEHLLLAVLDVEGTAGQVLRGLGVDVDRLRASLDAAADVGAGKPTEPRATDPKCPSCDAPLETSLVSRTIADAVVFSCAACGGFLGVAPA